MPIQEAYNQWSEFYDFNENKTRDLEAFALRRLLSGFKCSKILELGCGTGKNTEWLVNRSEMLVAVDFSENMLVKAKEKSSLKKVNFIQADIKQSWNFTHETFNLITVSLVLEHIENLEHIFQQVYEKLEPNGFFYIGELHPFKQYLGSKARFDSKNGLQVLECFTHHISEFITIALQNNFSVYHIEEFFDAENLNRDPRILSILFKKN